MYVALKEKRIHIPGDERSRTNPGHGYPDRWEVFWEGITFQDKEDLITWIRQRSPEDKFMVIEGEEVPVTRKIQIRLGEYED